MPDIVTTLDRPSVPADGTTVSATIEIQPGSQNDEVSRQLVLCVDTSGSMSGEKIERVREGIRWVFGYLEGSDYVAVVSFDDETRVMLPAQCWGDLSREDADDAVASIQAGGGTDILGGLQLARETFRDLPPGEDVGRRILLLSDGRDEAPADEFADLARQYRRKDGIAIPAAGIGKFYDEEIIRAIGTASEGEWVHLSRPEEIENFFGRKVEDLRTIVAPNPYIQLDLAPGVDVEEVLLRKPQVQDANHVRDGDAVRIFIPDLVEFEEQEVVLKIQVPPGEVGTKRSLAEVSINSPETVDRTSVDVQYSDDPTDLETRISDIDFKHMDTKIRKEASEGNIEEAETIIEEAETIIEQATKIDSDIDVNRMRTVVEKAKEGGVKEEYLTTKIKDS